MGACNTCGNGCKYCYANFSDERVRENIGRYDAESPILCDTVMPGETVVERKVKSLKKPAEVIRGDFSAQKLRAMLWSRGCH